MKPVALGTLFFAIFSATPALLLPLGALLSQVPRRPDVWGDFLLVAYIVALSSALQTAGFLIASALSARWRRLPGWRAVIIASGLGLVGPVVGLLVAVVSAPAVLPLFRSAPGSHLPSSTVSPGSCSASWRCWSRGRGVPRRRASPSRRSTLGC
jgi:hypothetical protein